MGIRTKFNPMGGVANKSDEPPVFNSYKAYIINGSTVTDVATKGFSSAINIETTKGGDGLGSNCVILNGILYKYTGSALSQIATGVSFVAGIAGSGDVVNSEGIGIDCVYITNSNGLYYQDPSKSYKFTYYGSNYYYAMGGCYGSNYMRVFGTSGGVQMIMGYPEIGLRTNTFSIPQNLVQIRSMQGYDWLGIDNMGVAYRGKNSGYTALPIKSGLGLGDKVELITESDQRDNPPLAICNTILCYSSLNSTGGITVYANNTSYLSQPGWTYLIKEVCQPYRVGNIYYGIRNGDLYKINYSNAPTLLNSGGWNIVKCNDNAGLYGIKDWKLYSVNTSNGSLTLKLNNCVKLYMGHAGYGLAICGVS